MNKILLHIPHSATKIPKMFWKDVCVEKEVIIDFVKNITDTDTDKLFGTNKYKRICFPCSRVFCDVEKFADDTEIMNKFGMGVVYTKTNKGVEFRKPNEDYKKHILEKYYYPYHNELDKQVQKLLKGKDKVILVDCHSFGKEIIMFNNKRNNLPDICVGFNGVLNKLAQQAFNYFTNLGYNVKFNYPYEGTIIPNSLIKKPNKKLLSVMLEINKEIYLHDKHKFEKLQSEINNFLKIVENTEF